MREWLRNVYLAIKTVGEGLYVTLWYFLQTYQRRAFTQHFEYPELPVPVKPRYRGFHRFIPTLLKMRGYRVLEVPVKNRPRRFGQSKYGVMNRVFVATADLLVVRWMKNRFLRYEVAEDLGGEPGRE